MNEKWFDMYELKAREVPGLIAVFPIVIDALYSAPILNSWPVFTITGICGFALVYALGQVAAGLGERIQAGLWAGWGGPPSTRFMRDTDPFFGVKLKGQIRKALERTFPGLLTEEDISDKSIEDAFRRVRDYLRQNDPKGLWQTHNIEYGFCRNLLGCRVPWVVVAGLAAVFACAYGIQAGRGLVNPASVINALAVFCGLYIGWRLLPGATKRSADAYAESAWMAFLRLAEQYENRVLTAAAEAKPKD